jgi:citrate synthase
MSGNSSPGRWRTAIANPEEDRVSVRGYELNELVGGITFAEMFHLVLRGELPSPAQARMIDAILVAVVEHGISPSTTVTRFLAASGVPLQASVAGGVMTFGDIHGGAGEALAQLLEAECDRMEAEGLGLDEAAEAVVARFRAERKPTPGFGHPQHPEGDPRPPRLLEIADETGVSGRHVAFVRALEEAIERVARRRIAMNVDGALAAIILDLGFPWQSARAFMFVPRSLGLSAHALEEREREPGWRQVPLSEVTYDGPDRRPLPDAETAAT